MLGWLVGRFMKSTGCWSNLEVVDELLEKALDG